MNIRFFIAGLFLIAGLTSNAHALYFFGTYIKTGSIVVQLDIRGVPNPSTRPSIAIVNASLDQIEFLCRNPNDYNVAPGSASQRIVVGSDVISPDNIVDKGKAFVEITFDVPGPFTCVNPNWTYIERSEVAKQITANVSVYFCTGDPRTDSDPCFNGNELTIAEPPADTMQLVCTLDPVLRNYDGTVVPDQIYACVETSP